MTTKLRKFSVAVAILLTVISTGSAQSNKQIAPPSPDVFTAVDPVLDRQLSSPVIRRRAARVNFDVLSGARARGKTLHFNLFPDLALDGTVESTEERGADDYTLTGRLADHPDSSFALAVKDGVLVANFRPIGGKLYMVRYFENGLHDVRQPDDAQYLPCTNGPEEEVHLPVSKSSTSESKASSDSGTVAEDVGGTADVLVLYTPAARAAAGGTSAMQALVNLAVSEANTAYQQSQINLQLRLVFQGEFPFNNTLDSANLSSFRGNADVQTLRNAYGADLVTLMLDDPASCGIGYVMTGSPSTGFAPNAFSLVHWDCATGYYSYAHELGHNMGCAHDYNAGGNGLYPYSHGHHFTGTGGNYRSIMSYGSELRVQRFSNPDVIFAGASTGVATNLPNPCHNALTINNTAPFVTNFRQAVSTSSVPVVIFGQPASATVSSGGTATFTVMAAGTPPLSYQWRRSGVAIPGATSSSYIISNVEAYQAGVYTVRVTNSFGNVVSGNATLTVPGGVALDVAIDNPGLALSLSGDVNWWGQSSASHDGVDAAVTGVITNNQTSSLGATFTGPGAIRFWWKVSSELNHDFLRFYTNGVVYNYAGPIQISGEQNWTRVSLPLAAGNQACEWRYLKDNNLNGGQDRGWLDEVVFIPAFGIQADTLLIQPNGFTQFKVSGNSTTQYLVQTSTNLATWRTLTNLVPNNGLISFVDSATNSNPRFYRLVLP